MDGRVSIDLDTLNIPNDITERFLKEKIEKKLDDVNLIKCESNKASKSRNVDKKIQYKNINGEDFNVKKDITQKEFIESNLSNNKKYIRKASVKESLK